MVDLVCRVITSGTVAFCVVLSVCPNPIEYVLVLCCSASVLTIIIHNLSLLVIVTQGFPLVSEGSGVIPTVVL